MVAWCAASSFHGINLEKEKRSGWVSVPVTASSQAFPDLALPTGKKKGGMSPPFSGPAGDGVEDSEHQNSKRRAN